MIDEIAYQPNIMLGLSAFWSTIFVRIFFHPHTNVIVTNNGIHKIINPEMFLSENHFLLEDLITAFTWIQKVVISSIHNNILLVLH